MFGTIGVEPNRVAREVRYNMKKLRLLSLFAGATLALALCSNAHANLASAYQFFGNGNWSIDAVGGNNTPVGTLQANVPVGATVEKAFLYSSLFTLSGSLAVPSVTFEGTTYSGGAWTSLGTYAPQPGPNPGFLLGAYRTEVTSQVATLAGGGSGSLFNWTINSENPNGNIDGEVLAIVYSLPSEPQRTIAFLDGFSTSGGDTTTVNFAAPLTAAQLADPMLMSLGIGFGAGGSQFSTVDINVAGNRLTSSAGGADDGSVANGALITAGGIGDNPANPANPNSNSSPDDELYTLNSFMSQGITSFDIRTQNPSLDDNIFFAGLNLSAEADVIPPNNGVPDPASTLMLLGLAISGLVGYRRFVRS
jgi:hypothetical protein